MAGLLDIAIARKPGEIIPVAQLPLQIAASGWAFGRSRHRFDRAGVIRRVNRANIANGPIVNALVKLAPRSLVTPAESCDQREVFLFGCFSGIEHRANAGGI